MAGSTTRDRILDIARERFTEHGYDGTSLREIAGDLGFTKAALYYHFQTKEQILEALMQPTWELIQGLFQRLEQATTVEEWASALDWVLDQYVGQIDLLRLMLRNRIAIEATHHNLADDQYHADRHRRFEETVARLSDDVEERVRLVSALAVVTGFDDWAPTMATTLDPGELTRGLRAVVADILRLERPTSASQAPDPG